MTDAGQGDDLLCDVEDYVATVTINRPQRSNALTRAMRQDIPRLMTELSDRPDVRVIVFRGAGDKVFSAGADLGEVSEVRSGESTLTPMTGQFRNAFEAIMEASKPTIALVNGAAVAGGMELTLACDMRMAADHAWFSMPEAALGMGANFASVVLPRLIPRAIALHLLYTGERIDAQRAVEIGLVNSIVAREDLSAEGAKMAARIASNAPLTVQRYKAMTYRGWELPISAALRLNAGPNPYISADRAEGVRARFEKRPPVWTGK